MFGVITKLLPDGGALVRRADDRGELPPSPRAAERLGSHLRVGARIEFQVQCSREAGRDIAVDVITLEEGARRLPAMVA
jgi:hypothetical protein